MKKSQSLLLIIMIANLLIRKSFAIAYPNQLELNSNLNVSWSQNNTHISFQISYNSTFKFVMFGFRTPDSSDNSDVVMLWLGSDLSGHFSDRTYNNVTNLVTIDDIQSCIVQGAYFSNGFIVFEYYRTVKVCDWNPNNLQYQVGVDTNEIVYALGSMSTIDYDTDNVTLDASEIVFYSNSSVNILSQTNGPFTCPANNTNTIVFNPTPTAIYSNNIDLITGMYRLYWNYTNTDFIGELHCKTTGWIGFGISPNGNMDKSDVIIGWVNNGVSNFTHRHIVDRTPIIDNSPLWKLLYLGQVNGYTILRFTRPILSCDDYVRTITSGTPFIIFAYGNTAPSAGQDISYHGATQRGTWGVNLINGPTIPDLSFPDQETLDFTVSNVVLPSSEYTFYHCKVFRIPTEFQNPKRHIFKWEITLPKMNVDNMHHLVIYECSPIFNFVYSGNPYIKPGECNVNRAVSYCPVVSKTWAIGAETVQFYPKDTGYPIGGDSSYKYLVFQIHYNNPQKVIGFIEKFKVRYYMTKTLQQNELAMFVTGADMSRHIPYSISLPPQISKIGIKTYCTNDCTAKYLSKTNITVIAALPHTHLTGNQIYTKIYRKGVDIGYLFNNKNYDFNFQHTFTLNPYVNITKDDTLMTFCNYNTLSRNSITTIGESTLDEMCFQFLTYYPRSAGFFYCTSAPSYKDFISLLSSLKGSGDISTYVGTDSAANIQTSIEDFFTNQKTFSTNVKNKFIEFYNSTKIVGTCNYYSDQINGDVVQPLPTNTYVEINNCTIVQTGNGAFKFSSQLIMMGIDFIFIGLLVIFF